MIVLLVDLMDIIVLACFRYYVVSCREKSHE